jgi:hypothetical protein
MEPKKLLRLAGQVTHADNASLYHPYLILAIVSAWLVLPLQYHFQYQSVYELFL